MDKKRYAKTRYQNIYKNIKNKNYIISISNPKTTISTFEGKKIYDINNAIKIRDDYRTKIVKQQKNVDLDTFENLWNKYIIDCESYEKMAYNTLKKKKIFYTTFSDYFENKKINKITKEDIMLFFKKVNKTDKQKNEILKTIKAFFNWCCKNDYLMINPAEYISKYKVDKPKLTYWLPEDLKKFITCLNDDIENGSKDEKIRARIVKIFTLLTFTMGDRVGETRALTFGNINKNLNTISIEHSINYDPNANTFFSSTKNEQSQRTIAVSNKLIEEIENWKLFLIKNLQLNINDEMPIIFNLKTCTPLSDVSLRKKFNYYIEKSGVPKIRMYDLRHTFVTTMMSEGWEMYAISERVGHKKITTTINTYGNVTQKVKKEMANTTDKYF